MRSMEWIQLTGVILHGNIYLWLVMKKSPVSRTRRFTYFQILCYALERWARTHNQILSGRTSWRGSKVHHNTELWTELIDGEPMEFEWNISPEFTTLQLCNKVQGFLSTVNKQPEEFTGRIIFMSIFNDISWRSKDNEQECELSAKLFLIYARRFSPGRWSLLGPGSERSGKLLMKASHKWNGT